MDSSTHPLKDFENVSGTSSCQHWFLRLLRIIVFLDSADLTERLVNEWFGEAFLFRKNKPGAPVEWV